MITQAVILSGGKGMRLRPLTLQTPKPMIRILGRPFVEYMVMELKKNSIKEIVFLVGYRAEQIMDYFRDGTRFGITIKYSVGSAEDDTGTRLRNGRDLLEENFLLMYGDVYWPFLELKAMSEFFYASGKLGLMVVCDKGESRPNVWVDNKNNVVDYAYGPDASNKNFNWTEVGIFIMNRKIARSIPEEENSSINKTTFPNLAAKNELVAWRTNKAPDTITSPEDVSMFAKKMRTIL